LEQIITKRPLFQAFTRLPTLREAGEVFESLETALLVLKFQISLQLNSADKMTNCANYDYP
jgi:hypothetical protein